MLSSGTLYTRAYGPKAAWLALLSSLLCIAALPADAEDVPADHAKKMAQGLELFKSDVRGLLVDQCIKCHGGKKTEAELDLTTREGLLKGGSDGAVIEPGKSAESMLYLLITHSEEPYMPDKAPKLADEAIAKIAAWIDCGAPYDGPLVEKSPAPKGRPVVTDEDRKFWSFQPLATTLPPAVKNEVWCRTPIDHFILAKLEENGLAGSTVLDRRKLIRRASFDLIGLPPTPEEIEAFVNDPADNAYEQLIDRLLKSPHYGERWGRHWLDIARFAESHGYEQDYDRPSAYHYRDFVIQALNMDLPYDRFVKLQLAGDELEPENPLAMMATGFLGAGTHATQITANQAEKERYDELDDMAATTGTALLGMTVGCARCHDHKFDPIPQQDYYRFISTFTTTVRSEIDLDLHPERLAPAKQEFDRQHAPLVEALAQFERELLPARFEAWLQNAKPLTPKWIILDPTSSQSKGGATLTRQPDGSLLASGTNVDFDAYTFVAQVPFGGITGIRIEALADPSLVKGGPGRATNGNFDLTDLQVTSAPVNGNGQPVTARLLNPQITFEQPGQPIAAAIDDNPKSGWAVDPQFGKDHAASFEFESPVGFEGGTILTFTLKFDGNNMHNIGRPRLSVTTAAKPIKLEGDQADQKLVAEVNQALATPTAQRTDSQKAALLAWYRATDPDWQRLTRAVDEHLKQAPKAQLTKVMVTSEGLPAIRFHTQGPDFYDKTFILKRGDLGQKQAEATQSFLQVLMTAPEQERKWIVPPPGGAKTSFRRTSLANWITDPQQGAGRLMARVIVNRLWQHHFGRGIVASPNDFGAQGERPTHPELLDWLAGQLIAHGWQLKPIHKLIMSSTTYMQADAFDSQSASVDPDNLLLSHRSHRRLEAEVIRDAMLATSGALDETMFGPGSLDEGQRRRSIYFTIKRSQLIPLMMLFDAPDSLQGLGRRSTTTIAPQALALLNNLHVQGYARSMAKRLSAKSGAGGPADAIRYGYQLALGRPPADDELSTTVEFVQQQSDSYKAAGKADAAELALTDFCSTLLCLNEFIYVE